MLRLMIYFIYSMLCVFSFTGKAQSGFDRSSNLNRQIDSMMLRFQLPGLQLAIVRNEQIVFQKSYGWANVESEIPVTDSTLFRIASLSKPVTVVALLKLIDTKRLTSDQLVFGENGILSGDFEIPDNEWIRKITVQHLINHKSGLVNEPDDPMFWDIRLSQKEIIQTVLSSRIPKTEPGTEFYYSNFGYCVLGRVIEKITGLPYKDYVRREILNPCGITNMLIGGDTREERFPNEATYYNREQTSAYVMAVRRMDSHGGWISSAFDLARLLIHIDRNPNVRDIISEESMKDTYLSNPKWDHNGSLPGTSSVIARKNDAWGYVALTNTRTIPVGDIINELHRILNENTE